MVELLTLGGLNLRRSDKRIDSVLSQPKRTALLVYLAVARPRGFHARDTLLALLWPEADGRRARGSLRKSLHFLRRHLGKHAVESSGDAVGLSEDVWCDVVAFDRALERGELREALELYAGDFLSGFHVSDAPAFERWLDGERRRLRRSAVRAAWELASEAEEAAQSIEAARFARRAWTIEPLDEISTRRLMGLLHRLGDRAGALRVYEKAAERLRAELQMPPSMETRQLRDQIRDEASRSPSEDQACPSPSPGGPGREASQAAEGAIVPARTAPASGRSEEPVPSPGPAVPLSESGPDRSAGPAAPVPGESEAPDRAVGTTRPSRVRTAALGVLVLAALLGGGLSVSQLGSDEDALGEAASTVAILPFGVGGEEDDLWREGMAMLLAASFHGATGLRVRDPEYVVKLWNSEFGGAVPTIQSARRVGRSLGAGWVVTGRLVRHGERSRLSGEALRTSDGERAGPVVVDGPRDSLFALVDRFTIELLRRGVASTESTGLPVELSRVTTSSLEALEAYLEGEELWRSAKVEEAGEAFSRAVHHDSTFALAHYRLAIVHRWLGPPAAALPALRSAVRHASRLHEREASLVRGALALEENRIAEGLDTLRALTVRAPNYAEGWLRYGDAILHHGTRLLMPQAEFRHALLRATETNPLAAEPYWHLFSDAFFREDSAAAARLVDSYRRVDPGSGACVGYETAFLLSWGTEVARDLAESRLDTLGGGRREPLNCALTVLQLAPRHRPALEVVAAEMESEDRPESERRRTTPFRVRSNIRAGRITEGRKVLGSLFRAPAARTVLVLDMVTYPDDEASRAAVRVLRETATPGAWFWLGAWHLHQGRRGEAREAIRALRAGEVTVDSEELARALEVLASSDMPIRPMARQLTEIQAGITEDPLIPEWLRFRIGELLLEHGQPALALRYLESLPMQSYSLLAPSFLLQGAAHQENGDVEAAREAYERFLRWWEHADPELEPQKERARAALQRLGVSLEPSPRRPSDPTS